MGLNHNTFFDCIPAYVMVATQKAESSLFANVT